ncbi:3-deoxy-7-phosphoheptulonate synthase [Rickettsiales endosymbiont of Stachyamoeba lipophora]|uniref:3-deoxy-7-phosphoheptulonate synthase n=1 Tax=Rickettsiales endosymbiont of Stachyamoeba lipophora TaxID=2486578 RepID=UPI000F64D6D3|nr:3-deoxy-7-phosphoheptulonate synthase [Rickettsiales endosymbiont of Stachyamoeba lipophora]AZL16013.1 hypothetical protein EF513_05615 [Rickettsiales endosymbiont of Stachyamoeba lipophora]
MSNDWSPSSWQNFNITQQPNYNEQDKLSEVLSKLSTKQGLCTFNDIAILRTILAEFGKNDFIIQLGDCAEPILEDPKEYALCLYKLYEQATALSPHKNIIKIPRIAGQFAKPRTNEYIELEGKLILSYRGDLINTHGVDEQFRLPNPKNLLNGYDHINKIRSLNLNWFYAHEALHLQFEQNLIRQEHNLSYASSSELIWIGNKTRFMDSAHIEFARGVINPVGIKIDSTISAEEIDYLVNTLNPSNLKGKILFIMRLGLENIELHLPRIFQHCLQQKHNLLYLVDPMHGNTKYIKSNQKYRLMAEIYQETEVFFKIASQLNIQVSGIHLESTYQNVYECIDNISQNQDYHSMCDPRLNSNQTLNLLTFLNKFN